MEKVLKEEKVIHKNRSFSLRLLEKDEGFYVDATDDETGKDVGCVISANIKCIMS